MGEKFTQAQRLVNRVVLQEGPFGIDDPNVTSRSLPPNKITRTPQLITAILLVFIFLTGTISPNAFAQEEKAEEPVGQKISIPTIVGQVTDSRGKPVADAEIDINLNIYDKNTSHLSQASKKSKSDEQGKFSIELNKEVRSDRQVHLNATITHEKFVVRQVTKWEAVKTFKGNLKKVALKRGIKVKGRLVGPDSSDQDPENATIQIGQSLGWGRDWESLFQKTIRCDENGAFELLVPENEKIIMMVQAKNFAMTKVTVEIPKRKTDSDDEIHDLGQVKFAAGTVVTGIVLDKEGVPCPDALVSATFNRNGSNNLRQITSTVKTDIEGGFELPPLKGKWSVSLAESGEIDGQHIVAKRHLPAKTIQLNLNGKKKTIDIEIVESAVHTIRGTVLTKSGEKKDGLQLYFGFPNDNVQKSIEVEKDGTFKCDVLGDTPGYIYVIAPSDTDTQGYYMARLTTQSLKNNRDFFKSGAHSTGQVFHHKGAERDIEMDFELIFESFDRDSSLEGTITSFFKWYMDDDDDRP